MLITHCLAGVRLSVGRYESPFSRRQLFFFTGRQPVTITTCADVLRESATLTLPLFDAAFAGRFLPLPGSISRCRRKLSPRRLECQVP